MSRPVLLTDGAARDLDELYAAAYDRDGADGATRILDRISVAFEWLVERADHGEAIADLRRLGMQDARQLRMDDVRVLYPLLPDEVHVVAIAPPARSMQALLERRTLDA